MVASLVVTYYYCSDILHVGERIKHTCGDLLNFVVGYLPHIVRYEALSLETQRDQRASSFGAAEG